MPNSRPHNGSLSDRSSAHESNGMEASKPIEVALRLDSRF